MAKINLSTQKASSFLLEDISPFLKNLSRKLHPRHTVYTSEYYPENKAEDSRLTVFEYYIAHNQKPILRGNAASLIAPFQHFINMGKDFINTARPYRYPSHYLKDLMQPLRGIGNILRGVGNIILGAVFSALSCCVLPLYLVLALPIVALRSLWNQRLLFSYSIPFLRGALDGIVTGIGWMMEGIFSLVRGATQIATAPLTWIFKIPLRTLLRLTRGYPKAEADPLLESIALHVNDGSINLYRGITSAHAKFMQNLQRGRPSDNAPAIEAAYNDWQKHNKDDVCRNHANAYLQFFTRPKAAADAPTSERSSLLPQ